MRGAVIILASALGAVAMTAAPESSAAPVTSLDALLREKTAAVTIVRTKARKYTAALANGRLLQAYLTAATGNEGERIKDRIVSSLKALQNRYGLTTFRIMWRDGDVVAEVGTFLDSRVAACEAAGIARDRLVIDPGFGFGKTLEHNLELLRGLSVLVGGGTASGRLPLLAGLSRKSMLGAITGRPVESRLAGSLALAWAALEGGARIIRCHDVAETVDVVKVWTALRRSGGHA
jgi:dihydropteroate synthase